MFAILNNLGNLDSIDQNQPPPKEIFFEKSTRSSVDLILKQLFIATIVALNVTALIVAYRAIVQYCPLKPEPIISSSFLIGVLGGLVSIKMPTCGVNNGNLNQFLNPVALLGRLLSYAFFGPTLLVVRAMDLTNYAKDVNQISGDIKSKNFEYCAEKYFRNLSNLKRYGVLSQDEVAKIEPLYKRYKALKAEKDDLESKTRETNIAKDPMNESKKRYDKIVSRITRVENKWIKIQYNLNPAHIKYIKKDYSNWRVRLWVKFTKLFENPEELKLA